MVLGPVGSSRFALELEGTIVGWVQKVGGGAAHADVVSELGGHKHVGAVHFEDIVVACGTGMSKAFYDWVAQGSDVGAGAPGKNGAIITCDLQGRVVSRLDWMHGLISAVNFPVLDAASKTQAALTVKITPDLTRRRSGDGGRITFPHKPSKAWLASNFRLTIDGLEDPCRRVSRVGAITITRDVQRDVVGAARETFNEPGRVKLSDVVITLPESRAKPFYDWFEDFVINGNNTATSEKSGTLDLLTPNLSSTLFSLRLGHLGIYEIDEPSSTGHLAEIRKVMVKMYCETLRLVAGAAAG